MNTTGRIVLNLFERPILTDYSNLMDAHGGIGRVASRTPASFPNGLTNTHMRTILELLFRRLGSRRSTSMTHPLVIQLRFARSELRRAIARISEDDARHRFEPMNCISWSIGHLAAQEQRYWFNRRGLDMPLPAIHAQFGYGAPSVVPGLAEMLTAWEQITVTADPWLDQVTTAELAELHNFEFRGQEANFRFGTFMQRTIYHYWYHIGEIMAIRQLLGHINLPEFVGNIDDEAPFLGT
jgi:hypothetical protein